MSQDLETQKNSWLKAPNWPAMLSVTTALIAFSTVMLHLIGATRHRNYLNFWGIDQGLFPKAADWTLINGYYGVFDRFIAILGATLSSLHWLAFAGIILGIYVFVLCTPSSGSAKKPAWLERRSARFQRFFRQVALTTIIVWFSPLALFVFTAVLAVPAAFGEIAGKSAAEREASEYVKGCKQSSISCVELSKDGNVIATGFVLDSTTSHIAIFDEKLQRGRVIPMENIEIISKKIIK
jgi:hypothetical protein